MNKKKIFNFFTMVTATEPDDDIGVRGRRASERRGWPNGIKRALGGRVEKKLVNGISARKTAKFRALSPSYG